MIFLLLCPELVGFRKIKQRINTDERVGFGYSHNAKNIFFVLRIAYFYFPKEAACLPSQCCLM
jgi:hypothetical protein